MEIAKYNEMMSYLTRNNLKDKVKFASDLDQPIPKKSIVELEAFNRFNRDNPNPRTKKSDGGELIVEPSESMKVDTTTSNPVPEFDLTDFRNKAEIFVLAHHNRALPREDIIFKLNSLAQQGIDAGTFTMEEAADVVQKLKFEAQDRAQKQRLRDVVPEGIGTIKREDFADSIAPKVEKFKELVEKGDSLNDAKKKVIKLFKLKRSKTAGNPVWYTVGKKELVKDGVLEDKEKGKMKIIGETPSFYNDKNIERIERKGSGEENIKKVTYRNKSTGETFVKYKPLLRSNTVSVSGAGFDTIEEAIKVRDDYDAANPKKVAVTLKLEEDLKKLADSPRLAPLLKTGTPDKKYLKVVQDILGLNVSQAEDKLKQLGEAVRPGSTFDIPGINKISEKKAKNISNFYKSKSVSKTVVDKEIGKSVGEKSLKTLRADVQKKLPFPGGPETFETDEAKAKMGSFRLGSKPYSIFGQVIDGRLNQGDKMRVDSQLSILEESVQKALKGELFDKKGNKIPVRVAVQKYNAAATEAEKEFNSQKMRNFKPVRIPKISLKSPDKAIANKAAYKKYKQYFDDNYKKLGYSFEIPKDLKPIPEIAADLKNTNSSEYKNMIRNVKEVGKKFIKDINKYDEKDLLKIFNDPKFQQFKKLMPRLVSNDDFSERRYAFAENIMTDAGPINLMPAPKEDEEQTFGERNPITTGVGLTVPSAVAVQRAAGVPVLKALANIGKYPLKAVGSLPGAMYFAGDTIADRLEEGKSIPDAVIDKEVGIELLLPEAFKRFGPLMMKAARVSTPIGATLTAAGLAKDAYQRAQELKAMSPEERAALAQERDEFTFGEYSGAKDGGLMRQGFADGPKDPGRRNFMKIMGGLASLPLVGRFFEVGEKVKPVVQNMFTEIKKLKDTKTLMPDWFPSFVNKFRKEGKAENMFKKKRIEVTKQEYDQAVAEGKNENYFHDAARTEEYKANTPDYKEYYKIEDTDELIGTTYTNEKFPGVEIDDFDGEVQVNWENDYSQPVNIVYVEPGKTGPDLGRVDKFAVGIEKKEFKPKGEFSAMDQEVYATDPDGGFDTEAVIVDSLDDMMEGTTRQMEEYATGKKVKNLSRGEGKVIEAEVRANQMADQAGELDQADYEGDPINLMDDRDYGDAGFDD